MTDSTKRDEQLAREWLQFRKFEFPLVSEDQELLNSVLRLLSQVRLEEVRLIKGWIAKFTDFRSPMQNMFNAVSKREEELEGALRAAGGK